MRLPDLPSPTHGAAAAAVAADNGVERVRRVAFPTAAWWVTSAPSGPWLQSLPPVAATGAKWPQWSCPPGLCAWTAALLGSVTLGLAALAEEASGVSSTRQPAAMSKFRQADQVLIGDHSQQGG